MTFRPALLPTLATAVALAILLGLGTWQLGRHAEASARMERVEARLYEPPLGNAELAAPPEELDWRKAILTGTWAPPVQFVAGRMERGEPGYDVFQPLQLDEGPAVLVNRGWIPATGWEDHLATIGTEGPAQVEGLVQAVAGAGTEAGAATPEPLPADGDKPARWTPTTTWWLGVLPRLLGAPVETIAARARQARPDLLGVWVAAGPALRRGEPKATDHLPVSGYVPEPRQIGHLEYAIQWFLIAATALAVWGYAGWRRGQRLLTAQAAGPRAAPAPPGSPGRR
ncbi:MAG: hypothetical protein H6732_03065 [Alphaproteobacteria bacterium]|nr:hypothetical protein [Alphaproteobacteria bacterium]